MKPKMFFVFCASRFLGSKMSINEAKNGFALRGFGGQKLSSMKPKMFMNEFALRAENGHKIQSINHK